MIQGRVIELENEEVWKDGKAPKKEDNFPISSFPIDILTVLIEISHNAHNGYMLNTSNPSDTDKISHLFIYISEDFFANRFFCNPPGCNVVFSP